MTFVLCVMVPSVFTVVFAPGGRIGPLASAESSGFLSPRFISQLGWGQKPIFRVNWELNVIEWGIGKENQQNPRTL